MARIIGFFSSLKLAVICLALLFILVLWGTVYQVEHGLYAAQQVFFRSWFILILGVIPFPGTALVLWVFSINLLLAMLSRFRYGWRQSGLILIHAGLLMLLLGGFITMIHGEESSLTLFEGEGSNLSSSYREWEVSVWTGDEIPRDVTAIDSDRFKAGSSIDFLEFGFDLTVDKYFANSDAFTSDEQGGNANVRNASGIVRIAWKELEKEPERNLPAGLFTIDKREGADEQIYLFGGEMGPTVVEVAGKPVHFQLRRKQYELPLLIKLLDFKRELHPNTQMAKSYSSRVTVFESGDLQRNVLIEMNQPFRYQGLTFFQASFSQGETGEASTFAVTKNYGRLVPYFATAVVTLGLILHFFIALVFPRRRGKGVA